MAQIKSYTDIEQSKKLTEILPIESADMMYHSVENEYGNGAFVATSNFITNGFKNDNFYSDDIPCWSLAALLSVISNYKLSSEHNYHTCTAETHFGTGTVAWFNNPIDACYEMILKLHELNLL